jgi:hypothetical protein
LAKPASQPKPTTGAALRAQARGRNRWMAIGAAAFVIAVFAGVMAATIVNKRYLEARRHDAIRHAAVR